MYLLAIFAIVNFKHAFGFRSIDTWENIFAVNPRSMFSSEDALHEAQSLYYRNMERNTNHPFVIKYSESCGQLCHDRIKAKIMTISGSHYGIISTDHALTHLSHNDMQALSNNFENQIEDFAPVLPIMKIEKDIEVDGYCQSAESSSVPLHVVFMPITEDEIRSLVDNAPSELNSHILSETHHSFVFSGQFSELSPSKYSTTVLIESPCDIAQATLTYLSEQSVVQWIEVRPQMKFFTEWANGITQSGDDTVNILKLANLTGWGEVIGVADTGLDMMSCFFYDPDVKAPYDKVDYTHRKVVYYETFADDNDQDGHGTLVCGTAAGQDRTRTAVTDAFDAAAFKAKISFFDIGL
jgi:hypothetical protein